ncbi:hypothetical protein [Streptomyces pakalii]|uniref:hypothetical protein n=1 Tax=Streptomyces pakalii TaxID=3036494 RepID=UPI0037D9E608
MSGPALADVRPQLREAGRDDRWGIFVGEWAPTFFALGLALANYERDQDPRHSTSH